MELLCEETPALVDTRSDLEVYIQDICGGKDAINFSQFVEGDVIEAFRAAREWTHKFLEVIEPLGEDAPRVICEGARVYIYYTKE